MEYYAKLELGNGKYAIVDIENYARLKGIGWYYCEKSGVVKGTTLKGKSYRSTKKNQYTYFLHRYLMNETDENYFIIHKNGNKLDNRMCNLERIYKKYYMRESNRGKIIGWKEKTTSKYHGVCFIKTRGYYKTYINYHGTVEIGYYRDEILAAQMYNFFAKYYEIKVLNEVPDLSEEEVKERMKFEKFERLMRRKKKIFY